LIGYREHRDMAIIRLLLGVLIGGAIGSVLGYLGKCSSGTCPLTANPFRGALYGAIVGVLLASLLSVPPQEGATPSEDKSILPKETMRAPGNEAVITKEGSEESGLIHIDNESDFEAKVLNASGICLVDLFSDRCPPCRMLAPTISSLADRYTGKVAVCKVNLDRAPAIAREYRVMAIPTVLIIKDGKEVKRLVGLRPESEYANQLDELIH
jgi:thioredoxin 1